jgi:hypothetical protein
VKQDTVDEQTFGDILVEHQHRLTQAWEMNIILCGINRDPVHWEKQPQQISSRHPRLTILNDSAIQNVIAFSTAFPSSS